MKPESVPALSSREYKKAFEINMASLNLLDLILYIQACYITTKRFMNALNDQHFRSIIQDSINALPRY